MPTVEKIGQKLTGKWSLCSAWLSGQRDPPCSFQGFPGHFCWMCLHLCYLSAAVCPFTWEPHLREHCSVWVSPQGTPAASTSPVDFYRMMAGLWVNDITPFDWFPVVSAWCFCVSDLRMFCCLSIYCLLFTLSFWLDRHLTNSLIWNQKSGCHRSFSGPHRTSAVQEQHMKNVFRIDTNLPRIDGHGVCL